MKWICCRSLNLKLELGLKTANLQRIHSQLPKLHALQIKLGFLSYLVRTHPLPLSQIFTLWGDLKELKIIGYGVRRNYDADCSGINEEAELLWEQDEDYLRKFMILPIRPCFLTMHCTLFGIHGTAWNNSPHWCWGTKLCTLSEWGDLLAHIIMKFGCHRSSCLRDIRRGLLPCIATWKQLRVRFLETHQSFSTKILKIHVNAPLV